MALLDRERIICSERNFIWSAGQSKCWTRTASSLIMWCSGRGALGGPLIVLPHPEKAGSSDAPEPLSSNDVAETMALNSVRISEWWRSRQELTRGFPIRLER